MPENPELTRARFGAYLTKRGPKQCWPFIGAKFEIDGTRHVPIRIAYFLRHGEWPPKPVHPSPTCDPRCVNPNHWILEDKRSAPARKKLTQEEVRQIRREYDEQGPSQRALAARHNVSQSVMSRILRGISYKEIT